MGNFLWEDVVFELRNTRNWISPWRIVVGAVNITVTPAGYFYSPLSESSPSPRKWQKTTTTKKSVSPHDTQFIRANVRQPFQVHSSSSRLGVRQIENEQQSTVGEVWQLLLVMAPASRRAVLHGQHLTKFSVRQLAEQKEAKKFQSLFLHVLVESSHILDVVGTFWIWS